ncbi:MAG: hypothetical protein H6626_10135 [Pseudobdellovibrionaceae bacterium]|nr:hypothetical protein [Bdellovibrionales bacterium]USN46571.1 MAG: hypothetical protein H6626_10135 [Pseudobdellovibrionaceae bacterium]
MSTLARYRKRGGFKQLLHLVETSVEKKRENLLRVIEAEDHYWAECIRERMLTIEKVLSWEAEPLERIMSEFSEEVWVKCLFALPETERQPTLEKVTQFKSSAQQKHVAEAMNDATPTSGEVEAAGLMVIKKVRQLQGSGDFRPEQFDPKLAISDLDNFV